jgi:hypothetical protein
MILITFCNKRKRNITTSHFLWSEKTCKLAAYLTLKEKKQNVLLYTCLQSDISTTKKTGMDKRVGKNLPDILLDENSIQDNSSQMTPGL